MTKDLRFFVQNPDNRGPDYFAVGRSPLGTEQVQEREGIARQVYQVISGGREVYKSPTVRATHNGSQFVLRVTTQQRDEAGRLCPITCLGELPAAIPEQWRLDVTKEIHDFTNQLGWTLQTQTELEVEDALGKLRRREKSQQILMVQYAS